MGCVGGGELALTSLLRLSPRETMDVDPVLRVSPITEQQGDVET